MEANEHWPEEAAMRIGRHLRRAGTAVLGAVLLVTTLTACSKEADGAVGIGPGAGGEVLVQIVTCDYPAAELSLLLEQDGADPYQDLAAAVLDQPAGTSRTYTLAELFGADQADSLDQAAEHHLRGTVTDEEGDRDMNGVSFTLDEVSGYGAGAVMGNDLDEPISAEAFEAQACAEETPSSQQPG